MLWVVLASFNPSASLSVTWPGSPSLTNYRAIWNATTLFRPALNSVILCGGATVVTVVGSALWGNFFVPFMLLLSPDKLPTAVTLYTFSSQYGQVAYGQLAAFSIFYSLPVVVLYLLLGRRLNAGFSAGGGLKA